jgi:hypothetical protein
MMEELGRGLRESWRNERKGGARLALQVGTGSGRPTDFAYGLVMHDRVQKQVAYERPFHKFLGYRAITLLFQACYSRLLKHN